MSELDKFETKSIDSGMKNYFEEHKININAGNIITTNDNNSKIKLNCNSENTDIFEAKNLEETKLNYNTLNESYTKLDQFKYNE